MKVRELIAYMQTLDQEALVVTYSDDGYEVDEVSAPFDQEWVTVRTKDCLDRCKPSFPGAMHVYRI